MNKKDLGLELILRRSVFATSAGGLLYHRTISIVKMVTTRRSVEGATKLGPPEQWSNGTVVEDGPTRTVKDLVDETEHMASVSLTDKGFETLNVKHLKSKTREHGGPDACFRLTTHIFNANSWVAPM